MGSADRACCGAEPGDSSECRMFEAGFGRSSCCKSVSPTEVIVQSPGDLCALWHHTWLAKRHASVQSIDLTMITQRGQSCSLHVVLQSGVCRHRVQRKPKSGLAQKACRLPSWHLDALQNTVLGMSGACRIRTLWTSAMSCAEAAQKMSRCEGWLHMPELRFAACHHRPPGLSSGQNSALRIFS